MRFGNRRGNPAASCLQPNRYLPPIQMRPHVWPTARANESNEQTTTPVPQSKLLPQRTGRAKRCTRCQLSVSVDGPSRNQSIRGAHRDLTRQWLLSNRRESHLHQHLSGLGYTPSTGHGRRSSLRSRSWKLTRWRWPLGAAKMGGPGSWGKHEWATFKGARQVTNAGQGDASAYDRV
jgi:hypothetical protein